MDNNSRPWDMVAARMKSIRYINNRRLENDNGNNEPAYGMSLADLIIPEQSEVSQAIKTGHERLDELYAEIKQIEQMLDVARQANRKIDDVREQKGLTAKG